MLRKITEKDLPLILSWRNKDEVRKNMYTSHIISWPEHTAWYARQKNDPATKVLMFEIDNEPLGVVIFSKYTGPNGTAFYALYSGIQSRRGVGQKMEIAALNYAFTVLQVRKLSGEVLAFNTKVVEFHVRHGFVHEGTFRQEYERDGEYYDIRRLSILRAEWEKLAQN